MQLQNWSWSRQLPAISGRELLRTTGSHRHYSNPFRPDRLITFAWHPGDVPRGIIADIVNDLGIARNGFYPKNGSSNHEIRETLET